MTLASLIESAGPLLTVLTPLVAVPLTVITFYLRSLREHQVTWHAALVRRVENTEEANRELRRSLCELERDFTTKEEWLRECMHTRRIVEHLTEVTVRLEAASATGRPDATRAAAGGSAARQRRLRDDRTVDDSDGYETGE